MPFGDRTIGPGPVVLIDALVHGPVLFDDVMGRDVALRVLEPLDRASTCCPVQDEVVRVIAVPSCCVVWAWAPKGFRVSCHVCTALLLWVTEYIVDDEKQGRDDQPGDDINEDHDF